jgi:hypothetical protein
MNIQDKMQEIHHKYGVTEKANYEIQLFVEDLIEKDRAEQLNLSAVGRSFIHELIQKENVLKTKLSKNLDLYKDRNNMVEYDKTFSQWNKCNLVLWDLKDILCRMGVDID